MKDGFMTDSKTPRMARTVMIEANERQAAVVIRTAPQRITLTEMKRPMGNHCRQRDTRGCDTKYAAG